MKLNIVYFPFSHLGKTELDSVGTFFPSMACLPLEADFSRHPQLNALVESGFLRPTFPSAEQVAEVDRRAASFRDWAGLNRGNEKNLKALLKDNPYFCDDTQLAQIQSQIRQGLGHGEREDIKELDDGVGLLLFLKLAQLLDAQGEDIDGELDALDRNRMALFSELKGELDLPGENGGQSRDLDPGRVMTWERIQTWAAWARKCEILGGKTLLVTTSRAVFQELETRADQVINTLDIDSIKVHENGCDETQDWQGQFVEMLQNHIETGSMELPLPEAQDGCRIMGRLQLGLFSGKMVEECFNQPGRPLAVCRVGIK
ncbi:MAG: hypothetical protein MI747_21330 [Desulfobacterales bacterium]|nr:hypothetical protein [Desulfobacterales bacterium]